jgi:hypothetical protein
MSTRALEMEEEATIRGFEFFKKIVPKTEKKIKKSPKI